MDALVRRRRLLLTAALATTFAAEGLNGVSHPAAPEVFARAKVYLQNLGGFLSSREAEDHGVRLGLRPAIFAPPNEDGSIGDSGE